MQASNPDLVNQLRTAMTGQSQENPDASGSNDNNDQKPNEDKDKPN